VFLFCHWQRAKLGFQVSLLGGLLIVGAVASQPQIRELVLNPHKLKELAAQQAAAQQAPEVDLTARIQEERDRIERLEAQLAGAGAQLEQEYSALNARRTALKPGDDAGITAFNAEADIYQKKNAALKAMKADIATAQSTLEGLLTERANASRAAAGAQQIVMYSTATCPACTMAKQYFARKGVPFREIDVSASPDGAQEFQRLGGRGVPLILVGDQRMEGFSAQRLDELLAAAPAHASR
jgi:glutaredoxin